MDERIINVDLRDEDVFFEPQLRPRSFNEYIGQEALKDNLSIYIEAAKSRKECLDHVLLYGPPGLGKTTLSNIIANTMGAEIKITSGPAIEKSGDMAAILNSLTDGNVLFIDEIHRLNKSIEEILYPAMEDYAIDILIGKGPGAKTLRLDLPQFTLIGATTRIGLLSSPLRDRFGVVERLTMYTKEELNQIIVRSANVLQIQIDERASLEIARRSRGTPRIANRLLKRVRDFAQVHFEGVITLEAAKMALEALDIDVYGLDTIDRNLLCSLMDKFAGGPVGLDTLAVSINEESDTIEEVYEPFLIQEGFLSRTKRGRVATKLCYEYFKRDPHE